jgi:CRISPR-associated protein Csb3
MNRIEIPCNPANPVNYLACCGLFDLLARMDTGTVGCWRTETPVAFLLESEIAEADFLVALLGTLSDQAKWDMDIYLNGEDDPIRMDVSFAVPNQDDPLVVPLEWWYETAKLDGSIDENSEWKMYAGNMNVKKTTRDLIDAITAIASGPQAPKTIADFLTAVYPLTGRLGFDFRSSRDALDRGYVSNDLKQKDTETFAFAELLCVFGVQSFFPTRCGIIGQPESTRGWERGNQGVRHFSYSLWKESLPIPLARLAANGAIEATNLRFRLSRKMRGKLANLFPAQLLTKQP